MSDKVALSRSRARRPRLPRSDDDVVGAALRLIRAVGERTSKLDPDSARMLKLLDQQLEAAWCQAVAGWRHSGFTDREIGDHLGVTKQAVQQRWPR